MWHHRFARVTALYRSRRLCSILPHLVRPVDDDALELVILRLLNRHRYEGMSSAPTVLPAQCHVPRDNGFDLLPSKGCAPDCVDLIVEPAYRRSRWLGLSYFATTRSSCSAEGLVAPLLRRRRAGACAIGSGCSGAPNLIASKWLRRQWPSLVQ